MLIDANLNFKQHVDKLLVKISKSIGVLGRGHQCSLVLPVMDYCDVARSSIGKIERDKLDRAQRGAARNGFEDQRFRHREEFKVASLVYEA